MMKRARRTWYSQAMPWRYAILRDARVLARCDESGDLVAEGGRVEIRYRPSDRRAYRAALRNLNVVEDEAVLPDDTCPPIEDAGSATSGSRGGRKAVSKDKAVAHAAALAAESSPDTIRAYTDGACSGNPGPCGVGILLIDGDSQRAYSGYLGHGTNNIAELTAIAVAADAVEDPARPVRIFTDSSYSIGVLTKGWKAKANVELIAKVKKALSRLSRVEMIHVRGHAGVPENERADELAVAAVTSRDTTGWTDD